MILTQGECPGYVHSSAAHISLRQGVQGCTPLSGASFPTEYTTKTKDLARQKKKEEEEARVAKRRAEGYTCRRCCCKFDSNTKLHKHIRTRHTKKPKHSPLTPPPTRYPTSRPSRILVRVALLSHSLSPSPPSTPPSHITTSKQKPYLTVNDLHKMFAERPRLNTYSNIKCLFLALVNYHLIETRPPTWQEHVNCHLAETLDRLSTWYFHFNLPSLSVRDFSWPSIKELGRGRTQEQEIEEMDNGSQSDSEATTMAWYQSTLTAIPSTSRQQACFIGHDSQSDSKPASMAWHQSTSTTHEHESTVSLLQWQSFNSSVYLSDSFVISQDNSIMTRQEMDLHREYDIRGS